MKNLIKIVSITLILIFIISCEKESNPEIFNTETSEEQKISNENFKSFPIDIELFKVPKKGDWGCKTGFGFCFRIVIIIANQKFASDELYFDSKEEKVNFMFEKISEDRGRLIFPLTITNSKSHTRSDFEYFEVTQDTNYGDVTFKKGRYKLVIDKKTNNFTYEIDVTY